MKNNKLIDCICLCISFIPILLYIILFNHLPESIPSHFDFSGNVNGYTSKLSFSFLAILPLLLLIVFIIIPKIDPKGKNYTKFSSFYIMFKLFFVLFMDLVFGVTLAYIFYPENIQVQLFIFISIGLLFIFMGNYMPKAKQNYTFGIKTPWTLESETVWIKTHRVGGYCFIISGILFCLIGFLPEKYGNYLIILSIIPCLLPIPLSYYYYYLEHK